MVNPKLSFSKHIERIVSKGMKDEKDQWPFQRKKKNFNSNWNWIVPSPSQNTSGTCCSSKGWYDNQQAVGKSAAPCLKNIMGAHSCLTSNASKVLCQVMPIEYRIREVSIREYSKIMGHPDNDYLKTLLTNARSISNNCTPPSYLKS